MGWWLAGKGPVDFHSQGQKEVLSDKDRVSEVLDYLKAYVVKIPFIPKCECGDNDSAPSWDWGGFDECVNDALLWR